MRYLVCDASHKLNCSRWPLWMVGIISKRQTATGQWVSAVCPLTLAWIPSESRLVLTAVLQATVQLYKDVVNLESAVHQIFFDDLQSGRVATKTVLSACFRRDLRHQFAAIRRHKGSQEIKDLVCASIRLSVDLGWSKILFHEVWKSTLLRLADLSSEWEEYCRNHAVMQAGDFLSAEWHCQPNLTCWSTRFHDAPHVSRPGYTAESIGQCIECAPQFTSRKLKRQSGVVPSGFVSVCPGQRA